jgi:hypothetical protein
MTSREQYTKTNKQTYQRTTIFLYNSINSVKSQVLRVWDEVRIAILDK